MELSSVGDRVFAAEKIQKKRVRKVKSEMRRKSFEIFKSKYHLFCLDRGFVIFCQFCELISYFN